jgi:hypothetical protein
VPDTVVLLSGLELDYRSALERLKEMSRITIWFDASKRLCRRGCTATDDPEAAPLAGSPCKSQGHSNTKLSIAKTKKEAGT